MPEETYIAIDLKSFYASVECVDRKLNPLTTHLVVADASRTEKTICLAVTPALKSHGVPGRPRLFEVVEKVRAYNELRRMNAPGRRFRGSSSDEPQLQSDPSLALDYVVAKPRMGRYLDVSSHIYEIYLRYIAPEHIHVYSIDEVFIEATQYLRLYHTSARDFARKLIGEVLAETGITATVGIAPNLYLCKIAMDIVAKRIPADEQGVRIAEMGEMEYRLMLWNHRPLTDFWRIGRGYATRLAAHGMYTMGDVAWMSLMNEDLLYKLFGVNAELLIDHAWGWEPCTLKEIKAYRPSSNSLGTGQVLSQPYDFDKARLVIREMADQLALRLVEKKLVTDQVVVDVGYDIANLREVERRQQYHGAIHQDHYGRTVPEAAHGSISLSQWVSSGRVLVEAASAVFDDVVDKTLLVRRLNLTAGRVVREEQAARLEKKTLVQPELFAEYQEDPAIQERVDAELARERRQQEAVIAIRNKLGKNAILKGMNFEEGATTRERNQQIGGHHV